MKHQILIFLSGLFLALGSLHAGNASYSVPETLKETLTNAQIQQKYQVLRKRLASAPDIPSPYKNIALNAFDHLSRTQYGAWLLAKADPKMTFTMTTASPGFNAAYSPTTNQLILTKGYLDKVIMARDEEEQRIAYFGIVAVLAHEITHSIQFNNHLTELSENSFAEKIVIHRVMELNAIVSQTFVQYQMIHLPEFEKLLKADVLRMGAKQAFLMSVISAMTSQGTEKAQAEMFARNKFVEIFWMNSSAGEVQAGKAKVLYNPAMVSDWNRSYNMDAFRFFCTDGQEDIFSKGHAGIRDLLQAYVLLMGISLPPEFFLDSRTASFAMPFRQRLMSFYDGKIAMVVDAIKGGYVAKIYERGILDEVKIYLDGAKTTQGPQQETYAETKKSRAKYEIRNGKMEGIYQEFSNKGEQLLELPVQGNVPMGRGWVFERGRKIPLDFVQGKARWQNGRRP